VGRGLYPTPGPSPQGFPAAFAAAAWRSRLSDAASALAVAMQSLQRQSQNSSGIATRSSQAESV
jgi:hypothetical protein